MSTSKGILQPLRVRVRRLQLTVGLGFLALLIGNPLSNALGMRLAGRLEVLPSWMLEWVVAPVLRQVWVLLVLPVLCYGAARVLALHSWRTALGAMLTGQSFLLAILFASNGLGGWVRDGGLLTAWEYGLLAVGVVLSQRAVLRGRADATKQSEHAQRQAEARKDEYAEFLREKDDEPKAPAA